jgi:hypothetical protein
VLFVSLTQDNIIPPLPQSASGPREHIPLECCLTQTMRAWRSTVE